MVLYCIVSEIKRDVGQKSQVFIRPFYIKAPCEKNNCEYFLSLFWARYLANKLSKSILQKVICFRTAQARYRRTDRRQISPITVLNAISQTVHSEYDRFHQRCQNSNVKFRLRADSICFLLCTYTRDDRRTFTQCMIDTWNRCCVVSDELLSASAARVAVMTQGGERRGRQA